MNRRGFFSLCGGAIGAALVWPFTNSRAHTVSVVVDDYWCNVSQYLRYLQEPKTVYIVDPPMLYEGRISWDGSTFRAMDGSTDLSWDKSQLYEEPDQ